MEKSNDYSKSDDNCSIKEFDSSASTSGISVFTSSSIATSLYDSRHVTPEVAIREQKAVRLTKALVFFVLLLAVSAVATATYILIIEEEVDEFEYQFSGYASEIVSVSRQKADQIFATMDAMSVMIASAAAPTNSSWPFVTVPNWSYKVETLTTLIGGDNPIISFSPIVEEYQRGMWSGYSMQAAPEWYMDSVVAQKKNYSLELLMNGTLPFIHYYDVQNNFIPTPVVGPTPSLPAWQTYPLVLGHRNSLYTNYDMLQFPQVATLFHVTNATRRTSMDFNTDIREAANSIMQPIFEGVDLNGDSKMVGVVWLSMKWLAYFQNLLVEGIDGIVIVLKSSCSRVRYESLEAYSQPPEETVVSYLINGPKAEYLGAFDAHDPKYDNLEVSKVLVDLEYEKSKIPEGNCIPTLTLHLYPTEVFEARYMTPKALYYTIAVVLIFVFTSFVFLLYDYFVGRRQRKVMYRIMQQDKIVSNVFPTAIRERLYDVQNKERPQDDMMEPLDDFEGQTNNLTEAPLADLFPNTSVVFADIAGFTAWSSTREPSQVFILLETIYGAFDRLAYRHGVFKIETVGDCYVAVAGLPEPNPEHATAVARFARGCMKKMKEVTAKLEVRLGPDTSDLSLRIGIHSGQVTAGVLRGERSRFQLFGDTMNTASRMESSGEPGYIQLSETTAKLLMKAGLSKVVRPRSHTIQVKGKGEMQTYWLQTTRQQRQPKIVPQLSRLSEGNGAENEATLDAANDDDDWFWSQDLSEKTTKSQRLVEWNVEILSSLLEQIMASRNGRVESMESLSQREQEIGAHNTVLEEFVPIIPLKRFDPEELRMRQAATQVHISETATLQLRMYLSNILSMYRDNPFHNFEHASHVTASVKKLLMRIVNLDDRTGLQRDGSRRDVDLVDLAGHSYGITSDPLTQFAVVFSAIIHDLDHPGVPNAQLVKEQTRTAKLYQKSVAEQNSVDLAWDMLMGPEYEALRRCIYQTEEELCRFRQLVVNTVLATDIVDRELQALRKARWETAFADSDDSSYEETDIESEDRKATIVIEHLIQASDVSHTMQHWHIYKRWNEKFFMECYGAYKAGRADVDPSINWYKGEIGFFDFYVIPLAKKLDSCGVFGVCSHEYLNYAMANRDEWVREGEKLVTEYLRTCSS